jgi:hypothetical protein
VDVFEYGSNVSRAIKKMVMVDSSQLVVLQGSILFFAPSITILICKDTHDITEIKARVVALIFLFSERTIRLRHALVSLHRGTCQSSGTAV